MVNSFPLDPSMHCRDDDMDGVPNFEDSCEDTEFPDIIEDELPDDTNAALSGDSREFFVLGQDQGKKSIFGPDLVGSDFAFTIYQTRGCSCSQIEVDCAESSRGKREGCEPDVMQA